MLLWATSLLFSSPALADEPLAPGVIVWMTPGLPGADVLAKAARQTNGAESVAWGDFAFARPSWAEADEGRLVAIRNGMDAAKKRWNDFDVEQGVAQQLWTAVDAVEVVRDDGDRKALLDALLLSGLAAHKAFPDSVFATGDVAAPFRVMVSTRPVEKAWVDAIALDPDRTWTRADVDDGNGLASLLALQADLKALPRAKLTLPARPGGVTLVVDGRKLAPDVAEVELWPGHHYVHALVGDRVAGRTELVLEPGQSAPFPAVVAESALQEARTKVLSNDVFLPPTVAAAVDWFKTVKGRTARVYLGAVDDQGKGKIVAYAGGATIARPEVVTALLTGDLSGGMVRSSAFLDADGPVTAPAFGPSLGVHIGIYNFQVLGGGSMYLMPSQRTVFGDDVDNDVPVPAVFLAYGGVGAYIPRPTASMPLLEVAGLYGGMFPGAMGFGGQIALGVPVNRNGTWVRFTLEGFEGKQRVGYLAPGTTSYSFALKVGFARKL